MNKNRLKFTGIIAGFVLATSCSPEDYTYHDNGVVDITTIDSVALAPNHVMVLADGKARLDLRPMLFTKEKKQIPDSRVDEAWLEYSSASGVSVTRHFSTSDVSLIGKTLSVQVKIKGANIVSKSVSFQVVAPLDKKYTSEIRIPIVFHIVQTKDEIEKFGGNYKEDRLNLLLIKLNNMLSGVVSVNPVGVNTHIRLQPALYDRNGRKMSEPGINRLTVSDTIDITNSYTDIIVAQHLDWPADRYMNIWLISDREKKTKLFSENITELCAPHYVYAGTSLDGAPEGIVWDEYSAGKALKVSESGIIYKLQELDEMDRSFTTENKPANNELGYYVGRYLGLLRTCSFSDKPKTDYCNDTHDYYISGSIPNNGWYKWLEGCYFQAENIMDDPRGVHNSVSKNQCERIRWVLENCPERSAWKSDFAFTGK